MADNTLLNSGTGGDTIRSEDLGGGVKIAVSKIYVGAHGTDGGPVSAANPLPVGIQGTITLGAGAAAIGSMTVSNFPGSQTVAGTVTANAGIGTFAVSASSLPLPAGAAQEHTAATSPHAVQLSNGAGFYTAPSTTQLPTALDGSGGMKVASVAPLAAGTNLIGQVAVSQQVAALMNGTTPLTIQRTPFSFNTSGNNTVVVGQAGKQIIVMKWDFQVSGAANVKFRDAVSADLTGAYPMLANQSKSGAYCPIGHFATSAGNALVIASDASVQVSGYLVYVAV